MRLCLCLVLGFLGVATRTAADGSAKHDPEKIFPELKVYDAQGRPWRTATEDWAGAKQRVASDPAWTAWLAQERAEVNAWITEHFDRVEWIAGWSHDGVSPKDGSAVTWTDRIPGDQETFFSSASDPKIEVTPKLFAWWVVNFRERNVDAMVRCARLFRLTGDETYAVWAARQMDFYADNLLKWETQRPDQEARLFWQTLTEASNLVKYVETVRVLGDYVTADHRKAWREKFFQPEVNVLNKNHQDIHNIATWQRCAVAQVALLFADEGMWHDALDSKYGLRRQLSEGITGDYLWYEQSLGYNYFVVDAVRGLFTTAGIYGRAGELAAEMNTAENLMLAPLYLRFPNGQLPNPADNKGIPTAPNKEAFAANYRIFPTTLGLATVAGRHTWNQLLDPAPAPPSPTKLPEVTSRSFESTRMAILRSGPWQIFFHYGQLSRSHSQAEALNFSAFYNNIDVTHDPGVVGYGSPLYKGYYTRGLNHNVPLVNGEGEEPPQRGELITYSDTNPMRVTAAQPNYRKDFRALRSLTIDGDRLIDTAIVETISPSMAPQKLGLALHLQGKIRLSGDFAADNSLAQGRPESFGYWHDAKVASFHDHAEFDVDYGALLLHVIIAVPGDFKLWHASTPDVPPHRRESVYLELDTPAQNATFTTTFAPKWQSGK